MSMSSIPASQRANASAALRKGLQEPSGYGLRQWSGWLLGPLCLILTLLLPPPEGLSVEGWRTAGVALLMASFWICEPIPIPATALLPLVLLPLLGLASGKEAAAPYANPILYLFLGGFFIAAAMQRWGLHRRLALRLIGAMGTRPRPIIAGFLLSAALLSMWVSNTATALMMLPIALSVTQLLPNGGPDDREHRAFATALLLAVAYGATTGGMATLIGTPPNALLAGYLGNVYGQEIGFGQWMLIGVPVTLLALPIVWLVLTRISFRLGREPVAGMAELLEQERSRMGPISRGEAIVAVVFCLTALAWVFRPLVADVIPGISDTLIAIAGALLLFMIPVSLKQGTFALDWQSAKGVPWDVLLLFGGGLSLAGMVETHGLSHYLGGLSASFGGLPVVLTLAVMCFGILMLTELTSNTATAATFLPVVAALALSLGQNPLLFLVPTALAANCSYMMPVGTPPNAIVFGSGRISLPQMARAGLWLNLALVPLLIGLVLLLGRWVFGIDLGVVPDWAFGR
jgi:solute carrier family 13 (sodium-dependent dicarboxylate transporter), member 2/3/5